MFVMRGEIMQNSKKYMFVSDIHGNIDIFEKCLEIFENEKADTIVFLGDTSASFYDEDNNIFIANKLNELGKKVELMIMI